MVRAVRAAPVDQAVLVRRVWLVQAVRADLRLEDRVAEGLAAARAVAASAADASVEDVVFRAADAAGVEDSAAATPTRLEMRAATAAASTTAILR